MATATELEVGNRALRISNPDRVYFPARGETKLDLVRYYMSVGDGIVRALRERPCMMHRFPSGAAGERGVPEATVSTPVTWDEIDNIDPRQFTIATVPARFARLGDLRSGIDDAAYSLDILLEWADRDGLD